MADYKCVASAGPEGTGVPRLINTQRHRAVVVDFMICFRESVRVVQFTKKSRLFVRSFVRSVVFPVAVNHSVSRSDSLPPSAPRSHSRIANASRVVQTHFLPPPLVLIRESRMPAESFRLTSSLRPSFSFANRECQPINQSITVSERLANQRRESASRISSASANETNDDERVERERRTRSVRSL